MRSHATILHLDLDAFFAAVEQRDKPSLRGKPVIVGGLGPRGVVSTASYEARKFGVGSAMPMHEARRRCPHAAFLSGRFGAYRASSRVVMALLGQLSPLVEQLSVDEAFVDLAAGGHRLESAYLINLGEGLRSDVVRETGGLTASVGLGTSKFIAKVGSELAKPDGLRLVEPGTEADLIAPFPARTIPGIGPVTMERLARLGVRTVADIRRLEPGELTRELGRSWAESLAELAYARDDRAVEPERETKSISVEDTFAADVFDRRVLADSLRRDAANVAGRLRAAGMFARTITLKVKYPDFSTHTRSRTLAGAVDDTETIMAVALGLLSGLDVTPGVRLLGVGVSGLASVAQEPLFGEDVLAVGDEEVVEEVVPAVAVLEGPRWSPGQDVVHSTHGQGWVWGSGLGRVTVRFETAATGVGPVRTFASDDPELLPLEQPGSND